MVKTLATKEIVQIERILVQTVAKNIEIQKVYCCYGLKFFRLERYAIKFLEVYALLHYIYEAMRLGVTFDSRSQAGYPSGVHCPEIGYPHGSDGW